MPTQKNANLKQKQTRETTEKLIEIATGEFSSKGYAAASTEAIVKKAGLTRGALYHHFGNKAGLFFAVFSTAQAEIGKRVEKAALSTDSLWDQLILGARAFLAASSDPVLQQIVVIDGPAVLKWETVRQVDQNLEGGSLSLLKECLSQLKQEKVIRDLPVSALAHLLSGAMDEASVWIARSDDPAEALLQAQQTLEALLQSLLI